MNKNDSSNYCAIQPIADIIRVNRAMPLLKKKIKILVAEDDDDDVLLIRELVREGFYDGAASVVIVENFSDVLSRIAESEYDVCLFDYRLGEANGLDLLRTLKGNNINIPVILMTGQGDQEIAVDAMKAGATDYLVKANLSVESLSQSIRHAIKLHEDEEQLKRAQAALRRQDSLMQGLAEASNRLLTIHDHFTAVNEALALLGESVGVDCLCVFEHGVDSANGKKLITPRFSWVRADRNAMLFPQDMGYEDLGQVKWFDDLSSGTSISTLTRDLPASHCKSKGILSMMLIPIIIDEVYWGFMGFGDAHSERLWSKNEESILKTAAANLGGKFKSERDAKAFRSIVEGTSSRVGDEFFRSLVRHLASALGVHFAFVSEVLDFTTQCRVLAGWDGEKFISTMQFTPENTPCEEILAGMMNFCSDAVQQLFPNDHFLARMNIKSYAGVPFFDSSSKLIGHLAVMDDKPMGGKQRTLSVLKMFAARAGAELERKRGEETIKNMAYYDALTGLPNRVLLHDRLKLAMIQANRNKRMLAIMYADFDRFKIINDTLGHGVGDMLLQEVGQRLTVCLREGDTVARLGGDEFIILQPEIRSVNDAASLAQKLLEMIRHPIIIEGHKLNITLSIGVAVYPADGADIKLLLKNADAALYAAKERGRDNFQFYSHIDVGNAANSA